MKTLTLAGIGIILCAGSFTLGRWYEAEAPGVEPSGSDVVQAGVHRSSLPIKTEPLKERANTESKRVSYASVLEPATAEEESKTPVERVRASFAEPNEFNRLQLFWRALTNLRPEDARGIQELFDQGDLEGRHYPAEYQYFARRWGEVDGAAAVAHGVKAWEKRGGMDGMLSRMADGWATQEPQAAVDWLNSHGDEQKWMVNAVMEGLINGLADTDLDRAREFVESRVDEPGNEGSVQQLADKYIYLKGLGDAEAWYDSLDKNKMGKAREALSAHLTDRYLRGGPEQAAAFLDRHPGEINAWSATAVAREFLKTDSSRSMQWVASLPENVRVAVEAHLSGNRP